MAQDITPEIRKKFKDRLAKAKPYSLEDPEYYQFDGEVNEDRAMATLAKKFLDENPE